MKMDTPFDFYGAPFSPAWHMGLRSGRYYSNPYNSLLSTALSADIIYWLPVIIPEATTVVELGFTVATTGTATVARIGLYRVAAGTLTAKALPAEVDVSSTGTKAVTVSAVVEPGMYMMGIVFNGTCTITCQTASGLGGCTSMLMFLNGTASSTEIASSLSYAMSTSYSYAALPAPTYDLDLAVYGATPMPHLWYRV